MTKKTVLEEIKKLYPNAKSICINYWGDSDDFEEFHSLYVDEDEINDCSDFVAVAEDYMFSLFNRAAAGVSFCDAGANGCIAFDLESSEVTLYNTSKEYVYDEECKKCDGWGLDDNSEDCEECDGSGGGEVNFEEDAIEHDDEPETF